MASQPQHVPNSIPEAIPRESRWPLTPDYAAPGDRRATRIWIAIGVLSIFFSVLGIAWNIAEMREVLDLQATTRWLMPRRYHSAVSVAKPRWSLFESWPGATVLISEAAISLLDLYLLIAGIFALARSERARRMHLEYGALKLPLILAWVIGWKLLMRWLASMNMYINLRRNIPMSAFMAGVSCCGAAYPIALLIALNTRRMKGSGGRY